MGKKEGKDVGEERARAGRMRDGERTKMGRKNEKKEKDKGMEGK